MKKEQTAPAVLLILCSLLLGCHKNKPVVLLPQQVPVATNQPPEEPQPTTPPSQPQEQQPPPPTTGQDQQAPATNTTSTKPKPKPKHPRNPAQKPSPQVANGNTKPPVEIAKNTPPPKVTIAEGSTDHAGSTQISAGISHDEAVHNMASTEQLLESTDANLRSIKRLLSSDEESIVAQVRDYVTQSKQATKDGDLVRAHNLALKAHLLSDELAKPR
jgi:hypothetical protein